MIDGGKLSRQQLPERGRKLFVPSVCRHSFHFEWGIQKIEVVLNRVEQIQFQNMGVCGFQFESQNHCLIIQNRALPIIRCNLYFSPPTQGSVCQSVVLPVSKTWCRCRRRRRCVQGNKCGRRTIADGREERNGKGRRKRRRREEGLPSFLLLLSALPVAASAAARPCSPLRLEC